MLLAAPLKVTVDGVVAMDLQENPRGIERQIEQVRQARVPDDPEMAMKLEKDQKAHGVGRWLPVRSDDGMGWIIMSALKFDLTYDELVSWFGTEKVDRSVRADAEALGFSGATLDFLCTVGIPSTPKAEVGVPGKEASLRAFDEMSRDQWTVPDEARNWIILGNLTASTITLDTVTGTVYGFYEGEEDPVPFHADVSSLVYTIYAVKRALPDVAAANSFDEREAVIQRVRREIEQRDPLPFSEESEWVASFEEIAMGMWT
ncbi:SUKH-4 family immunity protein [Streptomyces sp. NPDC006678]|uniref:SUKH-4 family immunity protein n=2 Tax=unclassified Streptomyces TaxID=2593676 RepID=UPI003407C97C